MVQQVPGYTKSYEQSDSGTLVPIVAFECRGCEPVKWSPGDGLLGTSSGSGQTYEEIGKFGKQVATCTTPDAVNLYRLVRRLGRL